MGTFKNFICEFFFMAYKSLESRNNDKGRVYLIVYHFLGNWGRRQQVVGIIVVANRLFIAPRDDTRHNKYSR